MRPSVESRRAREERRNIEADKVLRRAKINLVSYLMLLRLGCLLSVVIAVAVIVLAVVLALTR